MKLTNKQIKKIIEEELNKVLNENFSRNFENIKKLMVGSHEMFNVAMILFDEVKKDGSLPEAEIELLQKVANYAGAYYDHKKLRRERRSLMDFDGNFYQLPSKVDAMKKYREISKQIGQLRKQLKAAEEELGYDAFASSIRRNIRGEYGVLQGKGV